ncbi:MAG: hemolysin III family protein [Bacilli bacterium]|nr:hemolysin III family protein [Bacilli bacterium]
MSKLQEKVKLPSYTLGEELLNAISHGVGVLFSVAALVLTVVFSSIHGNPYAVVASCIYGSSLIILYSMSTMYHSLKPNNAKRVFRILDHGSIFLLIAGTYTPYTLVTLNGWIGWTVFGIVWGCAALGITFKSIDINRFKKISTIFYILMGWVILVAFKPLYEAIDIRGLYLLVAGGVIYTVGAIFYGIGKNKKYMHSIFHLFVLAASILQFLSILLYVV